MSAPIRVFVPRDSGAVALGAEAVAAAIALEAKKRGIDVHIVRNGSRGLYWLEPMVEVATAQGRVAYGPVDAGQVASLFDADFVHGGAHDLAQGLTEEIPYLKNQQRLTFARIGITDPLSFNDYVENEGYAGLQQCLSMEPRLVVQQVLDSGLRGRGGAAFPVGIKWKTVRDASGAQKYIVCNADEGDSGTFADRMVMENDPFMLIEGMTIAGLAVGATHGYIYVRSEYPHSVAVLNEAIAIATKRRYLGSSVCDSGKAFNLEVRMGAGSYVCGEETAMLNVLSFASVPIIMARGAEFYKNYGVGRSRGTLPMQLAGNIKRGGLIELAFGKSLRVLLEDFGGGTASGRPMRTVQVGGPLGAYLPESKFDTALDYEAFLAIGSTLGHGGVVVFDDSVNMAKQARYAMEFCAVESCGKCTPCRIGSTRGVETIDKIVAGKNREQDIHLLRDLCDLMTHGSLCAMGGMTPFPVLSALDGFPEDFGVEGRLLLKDLRDRYKHG